MSVIGVAIAVPEPWGGQLQRYRAQLGDTSAQGIPTHITLLPPVEVSIDQLPEVETVLAGAAGQTTRFHVRLSGTDTFRPVSPVVFVDVVEGARHCEQLAASMRRGPLAQELRFEYRPHVTIAHLLDDARLDRAHAELSAFECSWEARRFSLYTHQGGRGWQSVRDFSLADGDT